MNSNLYHLNGTREGFAAYTLANHEYTQRRETAIAYLNREIKIAQQYGAHARLDNNTVIVQFPGSTREVWYAADLICEIDEAIRDLREFSADHRNAELANFSL